MKNLNVKNLMGRRTLGSIAALATALVIGGTAFFQNAGMKAEFPPEIYDPIVTTEIMEDETPLAAAPKVTTKTSSKTTKKNVKLSAAATKTYTKKLPSTTKTTTKKSQTATEEVTTQTKVLTETTEKYTKKSKTKAVTTKVTTTITTTTVAKASAQSAPQATYQTGVVAVDTIAPLMDVRVRNAYKTLKFSVVLDPNVPYSGYFNAKGQTTTINSKQLALAPDTIYHELGHFLAFIAGNVDTKPEFAGIYSAEKSKFGGVNSAYACQSASEFFAECVKEYTVNGASLKASCPQTYAAIENAFNSVTDARVAMIQKVYGAYWK